MSGWRQVQLSDLVEIKHGFAFKGEYFQNEPSENVLVTPGNFALGGGFQWGKEKYYLGPVPPGFVLKAGDIIVTMTDLSKAADTLGFGAVVPEAEVRLLHNQRIGKVVRKSEEIDPGFLHWVLRTQGYRNEILANYTGSTVKHTSPTKIGAYRFRLPPLLEQQGIAGVLGALDEKIELNRRMNATLEAMARALFRSWFVDFDPVRAKAAGEAPANMDAATAALFPDRFGGDGLPEGWPLRRVGDFVTLNYGKSLTKSARRPGEFLVYGSGGVTGSHYQPLVSHPTVVIGRKGTVGSLYWAPHGCYPIDTTFFVSTRLPIQFVYRMLQTLGLENMNTDAAVPGLNRENVYRLEVPLPGQELVARFGSEVEKWQDLADRREEESRTLAALRDALLPKLMSGELRVREAEAQVAEAV